MIQNWNRPVALNRPRRVASHCSLALSVLKIEEAVFGDRLQVKPVTWAHQKLVHKPAGTRGGHDLP